MADPAKDGGLTADSPWRTDKAARSSAITYNKDAGKLVEKLIGASPYSLRADGVNLTDAASCGGGIGGNTALAPGY